MAHYCRLGLEHGLAPTGTAQEQRSLLGPRSCAQAGYPAVQTLLTFQVTQQRDPQGPLQGKQAMQLQKLSVFYSIGLS